jgi:hypothetical protein
LFISSLFDETGTGFLEGFEIIEWKQQLEKLENPSPNFYFIGDNLMSCFQIESSTIGSLGSFRYCTSYMYNQEVHTNRFITLTVVSHQSHIVQSILLFLLIHTHDPLKRIMNITYFVWKIMFIV